MKETVLVTGASSGIGAAVAHLLHERGFRVFGTTRALDAAASDFHMLSLDVTSDSSVRDCVQTVLSQAGRLDILVNNAGYALTGAAEETSVDEAKAQFETNFFGIVRMVTAVLPSMRQTGTGKIINLGSLAGLTAIPFSAFYCATKFALEAYSESLWHELKPFGITVTLIEPGWVRTGFSHGSRAAAGRLPAYDGPRKRAIAVIGRAVEEGLSPEVVAKFVLRAATSRQPRLRYRVGTDAEWLPRVRNSLPWNLYASAVRRRFALDAVNK